MAQTGIVFNVQRFSIHDGPGIRTTVFLKGCPLDCFWCHNPESKDPRPELLSSPTLCIGCRACEPACPEGAHAFSQEGHTLDRARCLRCFRCVEACPTGALEQAGRERTVDDVLAEVERDRPFYERSGGGMTLSGGEPLAQAAFALALLADAKERGLHTVVDTSGLGSRESLLAMAPLTDLFLWDLKDADEERHVANTGVPTQPILANLAALDAAGARTLLRCILIEGMNAERGHYDGIARVFHSLTNCSGVELLAYHELGRAKLERMGASAGSSQAHLVPSAERMDEARAILESLGVTVRKR